MATAAAPDRRTTRTGRTFHRIQEAAIRLFLERGYDATTVQDVAAAAGVSHMTVFRHFPTKEALVLTDEYDPLFAAALRARPASESPFDAVERAIAAVLTNVSAAEFDLFQQRSRLIEATPALQAALWTTWMESQRVVAEALAERAGTLCDPLSLRVTATIACAAAATASLIWSEEGGRRPLTEVIAEVFAAARRQFAAAQPA